MSDSKNDRSTAPRLGSRPSRAKERRDRNVTPPKSKYKPPGKPKKGMRVMEAQQRVSAADPQARPTPAAGSPHESERDAAGVESPVSLVELDDAPPQKDPWWTDERERAYQMALQGVPQHQISGELGRDRHTIARWLEDERFVERLYEENVTRFKASRQRRTMQTVRLTDKAEQLATKMLGKAIDLAENGKDDLGTRLAARDWLQEFRENSRREDEIYGLDKQRVDVNIHGSVQHRHKGTVDLDFKAFINGALKKMGVDPEAEEIDGARADEALVAVAERALMEGSFLDELVEQEKQLQLAPLLTAGNER